MRIVLFDGVCNFCNSSVQFLIARDNGKFRFASLQSEIGMQLVKQYDLQDVDSIVLIDNNRAYTKSTAALKIAKNLNGLWKLAYVAIIVPVPIRNICYDIIARNRYKWFGKKDECMLPTPEQRDRFI